MTNQHTLPPQVDITPVTFNALRAAVSILADGHERAGNELEALRAMVAQLVETVQAQAQQIAEMRADFAGAINEREQAVNSQLEELGAEFEALNAELLDVEERAHARIDAAVAVAQVVYAKQQQIQAESINDKPVAVDVPKKVLIHKSAADLSAARAIISQISTSSMVSTTNQTAGPRIALRTLTVEQPPVAQEAPAAQKDTATERALKRALRKVRQAKERIAHELRADEEEENLFDSDDAPTVNEVAAARDTRLGHGWTLDTVRIDEEEELYA
ncbi:hypothetical protein [Burkholderia cepacia]|uniref:hypothetical protein n=1 Tax=Burkholderia cepacia TaxID=292 RepID=UPI000B22E99F|nr:hypothetical protein [Burkholderia cepacia]